MERAEGDNTPGFLSPIEAPQDQAPTFAAISGSNDDVVVTDGDTTKLARAQSELAIGGQQDGISESEEIAARVKRAATDAAKLAASSIQEYEDEHKSDLDGSQTPQPG